MHMVFKNQTELHPYPKKCYLFLTQTTVIAFHALICLPFVSYWICPAGIAELGVMMMTTILVTIIMLLIWQINIIIVLFFLTFFLGMELLFFSSVLGSVGDGSWVLLVYVAVLFMIMYIWNYGSKLKYETEVKQKLSMDLMMELGCNLGTIRAPGIGLVYNELVKGIPVIFAHFLTTLPAIHSMIIFVCIKYVPVPVVPQNERSLSAGLPESYHMFHCIARYAELLIFRNGHLGSNIFKAYVTAITLFFFSENCRNTIFIFFKFQFMLFHGIFINQYF